MCVCVQLVEHANFSDLIIKSHHLLLLFFPINNTEWRPDPGLLPTKTPTSVRDLFCQSNPRRLQVGPWRGALVKWAPGAAGGRGFCCREALNKQWSCAGSDRGDQQGWGKNCFGRPVPCTAASRGPVEAPERFGVLVAPGLGVISAVCLSRARRTACLAS